MKAIRKIVDSAAGTITIEIPESFQNRKLAIIVLPVEEKAEQEER